MICEPRAKSTGDPNAQHIIKSTKVMYDLNRTRKTVLGKCMWCGRHIKLSRERVK